MARPARTGLRKLITHPYPNFLFHGPRGTPSFPPVVWLAGMSNSGTFRSAIRKWRSRSCRRCSPVQHRCQVFVRVRNSLVKDLGSHFLLAWRRGLQRSRCEMATAINRLNSSRWSNVLAVTQPYRKDTKVYRRTACFETMKPSLPVETI